MISNKFFEGYDDKWIQISSPISFPANPSNNTQEYNDNCHAMGWVLVVNFKHYYNEINGQKEGRRDRPNWEIDMNRTFGQLDR